MQCACTKSTLTSRYVRSRISSVLASFLRLSESHLQPYVLQAATVCNPGCSRVESCACGGAGRTSAAAAAATCPRARRY
eukprot:scaffold90772_cov60-Phaeocystis_antarctica.AAC.1